METTKIKNPNKVELNALYTKEELMSILGYKRIRIIDSFIKDGLELTDEGYIWGRDFKRFAEKVKQERPQRPPNQIKCPSCKEYRELKGNKLKLKIQHKVITPNGYTQLICTGECKVCGTICTKIDYTSNLDKLKEIFNLEIEN